MCNSSQCVKMVQHRSVRFAEYVFGRLFFFGFFFVVVVFLFFFFLFFFFFFLFFFLIYRSHVALQIIKV